MPYRKYIIVKNTIRYIFHSPTSFGRYRLCGPTKNHLLLFSRKFYDEMSDIGLHRIIPQYHLSKFTRYYSADVCRFPAPCLCI